MNVDLKINPSPHRTSRNIRPAPGAGLPSEGQENDLSWLVRIANFDDTAKRAKTWSDITKAVPVPVTARIQFGWNDAEACHIDQNLNTSRYRVDAFKFVPLETIQAPSSTGYQQALAEYVEFTSALDLPPVEISFTEISATPGRPVEVALGCRGVCPDVFISNSLSGSGCDDEKVGTHFIHYYDLSRTRGADLFPVRTQTSTELTGQYSCGPRTGPLRMEHPLARLREGLWEELVTKFERNSKIKRKDLEDLDGVIQVFGRDASELSQRFAGLLNRLKLAKQRGADIPDDVLDLLEEWVKGIQSRIICPVAMFDP